MIMKDVGGMVCTCNVTERHVILDSLSPDDEVEKAVQYVTEMNRNLQQ